MRKKLIAVLILICLALTMTTACGKLTGEPNQPASAPAGNGSDDKATVSFTDSAGRVVEIPKNITRIAPSGSMAQIVLFALAPDMFVGLSSKWAPAAEEYLDTKYYNLPVLGQLYGSSDLNLEELAKVNPQLVIDVGEPKSTIVDDMNGLSKQVGIPTVHITATTETMGDTYRMLGKLLGREKEAEVLALYCEEIKQNTDEIMKKVGKKGKANLLYCLGDNGLNVLAKGSFHAEILDRISNNVAVVKDISSKGSGNPVDLEQILLWNPDVIVFAPDSIYNTIGQDKSWQEVKAIKNGKYYEIPLGPYNWMGFPPSVNRYMGMIWITQLLYPEQANYDLYKETARYYDLFYHCKLTEAQYKALVANSIYR
ncbi:ABC transporter substrate-binding protein [Desulfosporosinus hippei]|uniref:Iron complex transport system substrate-binding protein n=1 Tax=Desulfosporosinus hippei DSM 8344 TaxID=1121419 RepID=A0A1G7VMT5_9FIRM|nr:ABC transporter substrate-binding protein [Desulfosporosinus hippei]SDG60210.1 iron complex transport system substrate-binding protein [Desulfosporosinus hippei DSM 8344]